MGVRQREGNVWLSYLCGRGVPPVPLCMWDGWFLSNVSGSKLEMSISLFIAPYITPSCSSHHLAHTYQKGPLAWPLLSDFSLPFSPLSTPLLLFPCLFISRYFPNFPLATYLLPISCPPCSFLSPVFCDHSAVTHLLFLHVYFWNMSVLVNMDLCLCECSGCIAVCTEQARANPCAN